MRKLVQIKRVKELNISNYSTRTKKKKPTPPPKKKKTMLDQGSTAFQKWSLISSGVWGKLTVLEKK